MSAPAPESRSFTLAEILSVTTRCLLLPTIADMGPLLTFMAGEPVWSHQLGRVAVECQDRLLAQHPALAEVVIPSWVEGAAQQEIDAWVATLAERYGTRLPVTPLAADDHTHIDPATEARMIRNPRPDEQ